MLNSTFNNTEPFDDRLILTPHILVYLSITGITSVIGILGNLLTMATFAVTKELKQTRNALIVNLAVADLMVTGVVMPYSIFGVLKGKTYFDERPGLCRFLATVCAPGCLASMVTICCISFSRYMYICKYGEYNKIFSTRNTGLGIFGIWIVCFLVHFPNHVGWGDSKFFAGFQVCTLDLETLSYSFFYGCCMVSSIFATFLFYFKIYQTIRKSNLSRKMITNDKNFRLNLEKKPTENQLKNEVKLAKTSFKIFLIFVCTWTPTALLILMGINGFVPHTVYLWSMLTSHSNSTFNFFIYYVDNEMFKKGLKRFLHRFFCRNMVTSFNAGQRTSFAANATDNNVSTLNIATAN